MDIEAFNLNTIKFYQDEKNKMPFLSLHHNDFTQHEADVASLNIETKSISHVLGQGFIPEVKLKD